MIKFGKITELVKQDRAVRDVIFNNALYNKVFTNRKRTNKEADPSIDPTKQDAATNL